MTDVLTKEQRRRCMAAIKGKNTKPELVIRSLVHCMGYRFRLHRNDLPGKPDLVFPRLKKVIFVHGCFWHQHPNCKFATRPATRSEFWATKLDGNRRRDLIVQKELHELGWETLVIWECRIQNNENMMENIKRFLDS